MKFYVIKPELTLVEGVKVMKNTVLEYESNSIKQKIKNLKLYSIIKTENAQYISKTNLTVFLNEGDILLFEKERGYFLPNIAVSEIDEAISDFKTLKSIIKENKEYDNPRNEEERAQVN